MAQKEAADTLFMNEFNINEETSRKLMDKLVGELGVLQQEYV